VLDTNLRNVEVKKKIGVSYNVIGVSDTMIIVILEFLVSSKKKYELFVLPRSNHALRIKKKKKKKKKKHKKLKNKKKKLKKKKK